MGMKSRRTAGSTRRTRNPSPPIARISGGQSMCPRTAAPGLGRVRVGEQVLFEQRVRRRDVVADEQHHLAGGLLDALIARRARVPDSSDGGSDSSNGTCCASTPRPRAVGRSVVDDQHLELLRQDRLTLERAEALSSVSLPIVGRHDDADSQAQPVWRSLCWGSARRPRLARTALRHACAAIEPM